MSAPYSTLTSADYLEAAQALLPSGPAWPRDTNTTFANNSAAGGTSALNGQGLGGAVFNLNGSVIVTSSTFGFNLASDGGGAIYNMSDGGEATPDGDVPLWSAWPIDRPSAVRETSRFSTKPLNGARMDVSRSWRSASLADATDAAMSARRFLAFCSDAS